MKQSKAIHNCMQSIIQDGQTIERLEARIRNLETFLRDLYENTSPTGPMADIAVHNAIYPHLLERGSLMRFSGGRCLGSR